MSASLYCVGVRMSDESHVVVASSGMHFDFLAAEKHRRQLQELDDAIVRNFPGQEPRLFVVLEADPRWREAITIEQAEPAWEAA